MQKAGFLITRLILLVPLTAVVWPIAVILGGHQFNVVLDRLTANVGTIQHPHELVLKT